MVRADFEEYVAKFNARDYDGALNHWATSVEVVIQGKRFIRSRTEFVQFYKFLHAHLDESIKVDRYLSDEEQVFIEARVRVAGRVRLTGLMIEKSGFEGLMPIEPGEILEIPQFIHYHLDSGKFHRVACVVSGPVIPSQ